MSAARVSQAELSATTWFWPVRRPSSVRSATWRGEVFGAIACCHLGVDEAGINADHLGTLRPQLNPHRIRHSRGMFGNAVRGVEGIDEPTDHRQHIDDGGGS